MSDKEQSKYRWEYYACTYPYDPFVIHVCEDKGGGGDEYVTKDELVEEVQKEMEENISVTQQGDEITITVGGEKETITDSYLTNVEREGDATDVVFTVSGGKSAINVPVDTFESPRIDLGTFG